MKWQVVLLLLVTVVGIAVVVYFATRRPAPERDEDENGMMDNDAADQIEGWGNLLTGGAAGVARLVS